MKKVISLLLSLAMVISLSTSALAADVDNIEMDSTVTATRQVNGISVAASVSDEQVSNLPHAITDRLQEVDVTLVSVSTHYYDLDPNTGEVTRAVMPEADFEITVTAAALSSTEKAHDDIDRTADAYEFMAVGYWYVNPDFEFTDCMGITWSDDFTLYHDEGYTYTYWNGRKKTDTMTLNEVSAEQGFAYDVDLRLFDRQDEIVLIGRVYKPNDSGSANVCASYGHVIIRPSSVEVSFSSGEEIGMSVGLAAAIEKASPDYDYFNY